MQRWEAKGRSKVHWNTRKCLCVRGTTCCFITEISLEENQPNLFPLVETGRDLVGVQPKKVAKTQKVTKKHRSPFWPGPELKPITIIKNYSSLVLSFRLHPNVHTSASSCQPKASSPCGPRSLASPKVREQLGPSSCAFQLGGGYLPSLLGGFRCGFFCSVCLCSCLVSAANPPSLGNVEVLIRVFSRKISIKLYRPFLFVCFQHRAGCQ